HAVPPSSVRIVLPSPHAAAAAGCALPSPSSGHAPRVTTTSLCTRPPNASARAVSSSGSSAGRTAAETSPPSAGTLADGTSSSRPSGEPACAEPADDVLTTSTSQPACFSASATATASG